MAIYIIQYADNSGFQIPQFKELAFGTLKKACKEASSLFAEGEASCDHPIFISYHAEGMKRSKLIRVVEPNLVFDEDGACEFGGIVVSKAND